MSLILEALRRSEAERKRGKAPSLLDGGPAPRLRERSPWPIALAGLALGLLIAAGVAWWSQRDAAPPLPTATMPALPLALDPSTVPSPDPTPAATLPPPPPPTARAAPPAPPPAPAVVTEASRPAPPIATTPDGAPPVATTPITTPAAPTVLPAPPPVPSPSPSTTEPRLGPAPGDLPINELAASTRAALPPLRLSMHVFNDDPTRRFAIVDGARLREGEALGDVQVVEIRRDGLRLSWQGRMLWLPR